MSFLDNEAYKDAPAPSLQEMLRMGRAQIAFVRGNRGLSLGAGFYEEGVVTLGSDATFFEGKSGAEDIRAALSRVDFPPGSVVVGDAEYRMMDVLRSSHPVISPSRIKELGLLWIDMLTPPQLECLRRSSCGQDAMALGASGERELVMLWENPYKKIGTSPEFLRIASELSSL